MSDNPTRVSFPFHLGGPGTMTADKQFSIYVSRTLDCLGKNQDMIKYRVKMYREMQEHYNILFKPLKFIASGSKAEGLTAIHESDRDTMIVFPDVICADNVIPFIHKRNITLFQTDKHVSHVGYTKLKLVKGPNEFVINNSLFDNECEDKYLSSDLFVTTLAHHFLKINNISLNHHERSGPSLPVSDQDGHHQEDRVYALRCDCPSLLQTFLTRPRPHNRPSFNELRGISVMEAHVVPVGHKGSNISHNEWRICFTKAELFLVQRFNETGTKLYIILKMVSKLLNVISKEITSYVMKNIVLWLVELYPVDLFTEDLLTFQLNQALRFLQKCVMANYLPSYMIPERNLITDRLDPAQKIKLTTFLSTLIHERGYVLLRCEKLRNGMPILYREPDMAEEFRQRRDMVEKLILLRDKIVHEQMAATGLSREEGERQMKADGTKIKEDIQTITIVCPEFLSLLWQGYSAHTLDKLCNARLMQLLS